MLDVLVVHVHACVDGASTSESAKKFHAKHKITTATARDLHLIKAVSLACGKGALTAGECGCTPQTAVACAVTITTPTHLVTTEFA
jgi:hypothetical protein